MSKRKSSADLRHGFNVPTRRPSAANLPARAMNIIHRKPGATNVRFTSSQKVVRSYTDKQRNSSNVAGARKSSVTRNEMTKMPKTRFNLASGSNTHTSRLKHFPVESVRKTAASWSYSPFLTRKSVDRDLCKRSESPTVDGNGNTWATNLQSHGYGDTLKTCPAVELGQRPQLETQNPECPKKAVAISQQHMPNEQNLGKINQSEAMLNERVLSSGQPIHRPFIPNVAHGMVVRTSSPDKSANSPRSRAQQDFTLCAENRPQQQREQVSSTAVVQTQRPQVPVCHQVSPISRQPEADQPNQTAPIPLRKIIPWKIDDTPTVGDYEIQPIGGRNALTQVRASRSDEKSDAQRQTVATGQLTTPGKEPCKLTKQQQQHQYPNQQGLCNMPTLQNAQQMHLQLRNNMIRQQKMQQRALNQQQQVMAMAQQQIRQQPLAHQLKMTAQQAQISREPCSNFYDQPQIHSGQLLDTTRDIQTNKMNIPHYRILMQQENTGFKPLQTSPQHGWNNQQVIGDHPGLNGQLKPSGVNLVSPIEKGMLSNNMQLCEQLKRTEVSPTADQLNTQQLAGVQWQQREQCPQYQATFCQYPPVQHIQQKPNSVSCQQYLSVQQDPQDSTVQAQAQAPVTYPFQQTSQNQQQRQQQQQQQQLQMIKQFAPCGLYRPSQIPKKPYPQFTVEMIRDQELLVANMRQQKIPENIMRRQFDALLSEQRRHLAFLSGQELAERINGTPPRVSSRALHVDQRPDWMGRITPARMAVQFPKNSTGSLDQQGTARDYEQRPTVSERMKQYDERQQQMFGHMSNDSQHSATPPHPWRSPNRRDAYHSWQRPVSNQQNGTALPASPSYPSASMPQMLSPPQATFSCPQHNNDPQPDPQSHSVQSNDFQAQCQKHLPGQRLYKHQCQQQSRMRYELQTNQPQQLHQIQQEKSTNCQQMPQVEHITSEQYQQREKMMLQAVKEEWSNNSNLSQEQHGACCKPDGPSSLLKLREFQKYIRPQRQNNGLQNAETVKAALEALQSPEAKKGLEYVAELGKKVTALKLNGTQDPSALEKISPPPEGYLQRIQEGQQPKISSNGLCNTRNANNPAPPPKSFAKKMDRSPSVGYPRQYYAAEKSQTNMGRAITHRMVAEKENGSVASAMQQYGVSDTVFPACGQAIRQYLPHQLSPINGQCQRSTISRNAKSPIELQGIVPIMPYRFDAPESLYHQQMEQFYRNRLNLKNSAKSNVAALTQGPGTSNETDLAPHSLQASFGDTIQPDAFVTHLSTRPDCPREKESSLTEEMSNHMDKLHYSTRVAENKEAIAPCLRIHQAVTGTNDGQPEIREARIIGGLTYLARKVDYLRNSPIIAPNTLMASKFLQPSVSFN